MLTAIMTACNIQEDALEARNLICTNARNRHTYLWLPGEGWFSRIKKCLFIGGNLFTKCSVMMVSTTTCSLLYVFFPDLPCMMHLACRVFLPFAWGSSIAWSLGGDRCDEVLVPVSGVCGRLRPSKRIIFADRIDSCSSTKDFTSERAFCNRHPNNFEKSPPPNNSGNTSSFVQMKLFPAWTPEELQIAVASRSHACGAARCIARSLFQFLFCGCNIPRN